MTQPTPAIVIYLEPDGNLGIQHPEDTQVAVDILLRAASTISQKGLQKRAERLKAEGNGVAAPGIQIAGRGLLDELDKGSKG